MTTKELLDKTYECKNLQELYTLINGNAIGYSSDDDWQWADNNWAKYCYIDNEKHKMISTDVDTNTLPKFTYWKFSTYSRYNEGKLENNHNWIRVPEKIPKIFLYFGEDGKVYATNIWFVPKESATPAATINNYYGKGNYYNETDVVLKIEKWKTVERIAESETVCLQSQATILNWYQKKNEYGHKWLTEDFLIRPHVNHTYWRKYQPDIPFLVTHDELELLDKMTINGTKGLALIDSISSAFATKNERLMYNRMFKNGKKAAEIFTLPMNFIRVLWNKSEVKTWDTTRKMVNLRKCSIDDIVRCDERNMRTDQYNKIDEILRAKDLEGKSIFTFTSLLNYLQKIDVNEAIEFDEGLSLITDTISMARQANQNPDFDTDSLKRTHDIIMRNLRYVRNEKTNIGIEKACTKKYNFQDGKYLVRQIESYADLMDEGEQQKNCLRYAYASRIADKTSLIYVMRRVDDPTKSLISIELDPTGEVVRQQYAAYNAKITNDGQLKFLDKWKEYRTKINTAEENI